MCDKPPKVIASYRCSTNDTSALSPIDESNTIAKCRKQRERRFNSCSSILTLADSFLEPSSPVSSTDQTSGSDITFEPTIEMMVNDFDDEQTLNEEEALEARESQNPQDEIAALQKESEMPIEELLAKYREATPPFNQNTQTSIIKLKPAVSKTNNKKSSNKNNVVRHKQIVAQDICTRNEALIAEIIVIDSGDEEDNTREDTEIDVNIVSKDIIHNANGSQFIKPIEKQNQRSHLMALYPEKYLPNDTEPKAVLVLESIFDGNDEDDEEDDPHATDLARKTIMVGFAYQAVIPSGMSKYGDVLPYENEDKLIWEPRQVSEKEVEDYLIQTLEIKNLSEKDQGEENRFVDEDDHIRSTSLLPFKSSEEVNVHQRIDALKLTTKTADIEKQTTLESTRETEINRVVKDNEQALHLLVQCGYDFKEALRRKRLNAVPLAGSMSIWSEEECQKFEEGIQKFGKDFLKIRQHQVRTRSMRELVQFYYLWKKSERRDHDFADSDTVDHMDMYLNEGDYSSNPISYTSLHNVASSASSSSQIINNKKVYSCGPNNFSIMTGCCTAANDSPIITGQSTALNMRFSGSSSQNIYSSKLGNSRRQAE